MITSTDGCAELVRDLQAGLTKGRAAPMPGTGSATEGEPRFPQPVDPYREDDAVLDGWIASLTADQFARVLRWLARVGGGGDGGPSGPER